MTMVNYKKRHSETMAIEFNYKLIYSKCISQTFLVH
jgi:hypothetical protein